MGENGIGTARQGLVYENGSMHPEERTIVREQITHVSVNGQEAGSFACSPVQLEDAAVGYLFLNGWITAPEEIGALEIREESAQIRAVVRTGAAKPAKQEKRLKIRAEEVASLLSRLEEQRAKGVHSCALICGEQTVFRTDVSRSAAVDKAAGACLRQGIPTQGSILVFSGRVPEGIVHKCVQMGCGMIVARSGPTDLACEEAEQAGITIVSHAGNGRFCIYTCPEHIV